MRVVTCLMARDEGDSSTSHIASAGWPATAAASGVIACSARAACAASSEMKAHVSALPEHRTVGRSDQGIGSTA